MVGVVLQFRQAGAIALELALSAVVVGFLSKFCKFGVCVSNFLGRLIARDLDLHLECSCFQLLHVRADLPSFRQLRLHLVGGLGGPSPRDAALAPRACALPARRACANRPVAQGENSPVTGSRRSDMHASYQFSATMRNADKRRNAPSPDAPNESGALTGAARFPVGPLGWRGVPSGIPIMLGAGWGTAARARRDGTTRGESSEVARVAKRDRRHYLAGSRLLAPGHPRLGDGTRLRSAFRGGRDVSPSMPGLD